MGWKIPPLRFTTEGRMDLWQRKKQVDNWGEFIPAHVLPVPTASKSRTGSTRRRVAITDGVQTGKKGGKRVIHSWRPADFYQTVNFVALYI